MSEQVYTRRNPKPAKRRLTRITIPEGVGNHVKLLFEEMRRQNMTYDDLEAGSGIRRSAMKAWRHRNYPNLDSIEATFGFLGWDFVPVPRSKVLPPEIVEALRPVAERFSLDMSEAAQALVEIVSGIHSRFGELPSARAPEHNEPT